MRLGELLLVILGLVVASAWVLGWALLLGRFVVGKVSPAAVKAAEPRFQRIETL